ncbi:MAG: hypothetical protein KDD51_01245 [Bdellovibrionales bacterium]|nr:hypothetical protein [Bdellovibrionales bacterium]
MNRPPLFGGKHLGLALLILALLTSVPLPTMAQQSPSLLVAARKKRSTTKKQRAAPIKKAPEKTPEPQQAREEKTVDLTELDQQANSSESYNRLHDKQSASTANFRTYFDIAFSYRPGDQPISFENFHSTFLLEYTPLTELTFVVGLAPPTVLPLYYEMDWQITDRLTLRLGRIWVPFDQINPHNTFGGFINTSLLRAANQEAFLPDVWADLGAGAKYDLVRDDTLQIETHIYVVNGFGQGGTDPKGESSTYPDFSLPVARQDNNDDKAFGARIHGLYNHSVGLGLSFFTGGYNNQGTTNARITMLGADFQAYIAALSFRAGYAYMYVDLPLGTSRQSYTRGGLYTELTLRATDKWKLGILGGVQQNDNNVSDQNDRTIWGGKIEYLINHMMIVSLQYFKDLRQSPGKTNFDVALLRYSLTL